MIPFYRRELSTRLDEALLDTPVVLLNGARQTGKTTLALSMGEGRPAANGASYSFDDTVTRGAAQSDPLGFLRSVLATAGDWRGPIVLDEVQHVPALFPALKIWVDEARLRREPHYGRFLLTGSANVLLLPKISESLAGRMDILTLWPLAQAEIVGRLAGLVDALFELPLKMSISVDIDLENRLLSEGFPEALNRTAGRRRKA